MKKILLILFCMILLAGTINAFEFDNIGRYNESSRTFTIRNSILGIPFLQLGTVAEIKLDSPDVVYVIRGKDRKVAEFTINNYGDYSKAFKKMEFYDVKNNMEKFERGFTYKYKKSLGFETVNDYETVCVDGKELVNGTILQECHQKLTGTHQEERFEWTELDTSKELPIGELTIGIFTDVYAGDKVEWIPTLFGVRIDEWALWTEALDIDLVSYYALDETSGAVVDSHGGNNGTNSGATTGATGMINTAYDFESGESDYISIPDGATPSFLPFSINMWIKPESDHLGELWRAGVTSGTPFNIFELNTDANFRLRALDVGGVSTDLYSTTTLNPGEWYMATLAVNASGNMFLYLNGTNEANGTGWAMRNGNEIIGAGYAGGVLTSFFDGIIDEVGIWNRSLSPAEIADLWNNGDGLSYFIRSLPPTIILNFPIDYYNSTSQDITFNGTVYDTFGYDIVNVSLYIDGVLSETNFSGINNTDYIFTKTLSEGDHNWTYEACGNVTYCDSASIRSFTIDITAPVINITYPTAKVNYHIINTNLSLNWTVSDAHLDSCWYDYNETNVSVTCSDNHTNINITEDSNRNITFYANDTFGHLNSDYQEWDYKVFEIQQTFSPTTIEGSTETFINNIFLGSGETITEIILDYNGTDKSAGYTDLGGNEYNFSSTFIIPLVVAETNITFFWKIILISGQINTSLRNQTVKDMGIDNCSVFTNKIFNYTIIDEELQTKITNKTLLELDIEIFDETKTVSILNFSKKYDNVNPALVCLSIELTNETVYTLDSTVKYEAYEVKNYSIEYYNIQNFLLQNSTIPQNIYLFDLALIDSTEFQITFKDSNFVAVEDALIQINRQYLSEGLFKTIEIPKTDSNGQTVAHLVEKDVVYNIIVLKEGEILGTFNNVIAFCEDILIGSCFITLNALTIGEISFDYDDDIGLFFEFEYNETTRDLQFDFSTTDGSVKNVTLSAIKMDQLGNETVCDGYLISSGGSIFCPVPVSVGNETIIISVFVDGDLKITNYVQAGREFDIGDAGYFLMFFLVLSLALMMTQSKTGVIIGVILGFISGVLLSFIQGGLMGIGSSVIWLIIMGVILIYKLNSSGQT